MLKAGYKANVIPSTAEATVDCRVLPGSEEHFREQIADIVGDGIEITWTWQPPLEVPFEGPLVEAMKDALTSEDAESVAVPYMLSGGTDNKAFARLGIAGYGFSPLDFPPIWTSRRCSTGSTNGCRWSPWSSAPGCSTGCCATADRQDPRHEVPDQCGGHRGQCHDQQERRFPPDGDAGDRHAGQSRVHVDALPETQRLHADQRGEQDDGQERGNALHFRPGQHRIRHRQARQFGEVDAETPGQHGDPDHGCSFDRASFSTGAAALRGHEPTAIPKAAAINTGMPGGRRGVVRTAIRAAIRAMAQVSPSRSREQAAR